MSDNNKIDLPFRQMLRAFPADFWRLWYVGLIASTVRWMETVVMGVVVYEQTGSALVVASITMLRLLPMGLFGAFLGAFAERFDRRLTLAGMVGLLALTSAVLAIVAWHGTPRGLASRRREFHQRLRLGDRQSAAAHDDGRSDRPRPHGHRRWRSTSAPAMRAAWSARPSADSCWPASASRALSCLSVLLYATAIAATLSVRTRIPSSPGAGAVLARTWEGMASSWPTGGSPRPWSVTVIYNVFAWPFTSMIPVIGRDRLLLGPEGVGILTSLDGVGAFVGALVLALWLSTRLARPRLCRRRGRVPGGADRLRARARRRPGPAPRCC